MATSTPDEGRAGIETATKPPTLSADIETVGDAPFILHAAYLIVSPSVGDVPETKVALNIEV